MRPGGADDHALQLAVQADVGGVAGAAGDLVHRLHPGGDPGVAVVFSPAGGGDRRVDPLVGAAPAQVPGHGGGDSLARRRDVAVARPPGVDEGRGLHHETRRAVAALKAVVDREGPLDRGDPSPSTVVISRSRTAAAGSRQLAWGTPSTDAPCTAPQTPVRQAALAPVRPWPSRRTSTTTSPE